jgi:hypothetical protein
MVQALKPTNDEFDPEALDVEWDDSNYDTYDGEQPPSGTALLVNISKLWWTYASDDTPMLKVLMLAEGNDNGKEEYDGLPVWDNLTFKTSAAFRYGPFLEATGFTLQDIKKKMKVEDEDERNGAPIAAIGSFKPDNGEDSLIGIVTKRERYNGQWQVKAGQYLTADEIAEMEEESEEEPEEKPARRASRNGSKTKTAAKSKPARRSKAAEPEPEDDEDEEEEETEEPAPRGSRSRGTRTKAKPAAKPAGRRGNRKGSTEDPPF